MSDNATPTRDELRAQIFASREVKRKVVDFFGTKIELRQPTLGDVLDARDKESNQAAVIDTLVKYAFIPKTEVRVFDDADADSFKKMPFGVDFLRVNAALEELTEVNFLDKNAS